MVRFPYYTKPALREARALAQINPTPEVMRALEMAEDLYNSPNLPPVAAVCYEAANIELACLQSAGLLGVGVAAALKACTRESAEDAADALEQVRTASRKIRQAAEFERLIAAGSSSQEAFQQSLKTL
jgi:hypothetical protein